MTAQVVCEPARRDGMKVRHTNRMGWWAAAAMMLAGGCSTGETPAEVDGDAESASGDLRSELVWGAHAGHPMRAALDDCVFLTLEQALLVHRVWNEKVFEHDILALGELFGAEISEDGDEFERQRELEKARELVSEEV